MDTYKYKRLIWGVFFCSAVCFPTFLLGQVTQKIGAVYPAGGQRGTTFRVMLFGRQIQTAQEVVFSGSGVSAKIIRGYGKLVINNTEERIPAKRLYDEEFDLLMTPEDQSQAKFDEIKAIRAQRLADPGKTDDEKAIWTDAQVAEKLPFFDNLVELRRPVDIQMIYYYYFQNRPDKQAKEALNQALLIEVAIAPDAECGTRQLQLKFPAGLSTPATFQVGALPELCEIEPNDVDKLPERWDAPRKKMVPLATVQLTTAQTPVVFNGQTLAGDVDRFKFEAKKGQQLVLALYGRYLNPYMADAVPGWFQPVITVFNAENQRLAYADCYKFEPDPVLFFNVPEDGTYTVEVQDSLFRGREDFVYRLTVGEIPWITSVYPPVGEIGKPFTAQVSGYNLKNRELKIDNLQPDALTAFNTDGFQMKTIADWDGQPLVRPVRIALETKPVCRADDSAYKPGESQKIGVPQTVYGKLEKSGQMARFRFDGKKDQKITVNLAAQELDSTMDAVVELLGADGKVLSRNDDRADSAGPNFGRQTHHSDPLLTQTLPADGEYTIQVSNLLFQDGAENLFVFDLVAAEPNFLLFCKTSSLSFSVGTALIDIGIQRFGEFDAPVEIVPADGQPGVRIDSGLLVPGQNSVLCTVSVEKEFWPEGVKSDADKGRPVFPPKPLKLQGRVKIGDSVIVRDVLPVEDKEQAFIYHHLMLSDKTTAFFRGGRQATFDVISETPVVLKANDVTEVQWGVEFPDWIRKKPRDQWVRTNLPKNLDFQLSALCPGLKIEGQEFDGRVLKIRFKVTNKELAPASGNLLVEVRQAWQVGLDANGKPRKPSPPVGWLPATPYRIE